MGLFSYILMFENTIYLVNVLPSKFMRIGLSSYQIKKRGKKKKNNSIEQTSFYVHLGVSKECVFVFVICQNSKICGNKTVIANLLMKMFAEHAHTHIHTHTVENYYNVIFNNVFES